jgi:dTDP-4-dehydrorhamnose reductase
MRVLVLGAGGMLARDLIRAAPPGTELLAPPESEADVTNEAVMVRAVTDANPDVIVNCAAYTNVDGAEAERERAFLINGEAPGIVGRAVRRSGGRAVVVHYGTDYVFDGRGRRPYREDDVTGPLGVYGETKLAGERALAASGAEHLIIRTQWLFGLRGRSFPRTMWERATSGKATRVVNDQVGRPTYTVDLARATWKLIGMRGTASRRTDALVHVANDGHGTWYDVARRVFAAAGAPQLLAPCTTHQYPTPAARPAFSPLDTTRYESLAGGPLPPWEAAVDRFLDELRTEAA